MSGPWRMPAAAGLANMILAARAHPGLKEPRTAAGNVAILAGCVFVAVRRVRRVATG